MRQYLYLIAWAAFSPSSGDQDTQVYSQADLLPQYLAGNEWIFAVKINVSFGDNSISDEIAAKCGDAEAFHHNYTAWDSTSICMCIPHYFKHPREIKEVFVPRVKNEPSE